MLDRNDLAESERMSGQASSNGHCGLSRTRLVMQERYGSGWH